MAQSRRGCGCALAALVLALIVIGIFIIPFALKWWREKPPQPSGDELRVHVLNVGQGDSILIISPAGKTVLVDAGNPGGGRLVQAAMQRAGVDAIDLLVATHAHADHIGGADEVINGITVRRVLDSGVPNATRNYEDFLSAIQNKGIEYTIAEPNQNFDIGGGARITVLAPIKPLFTASQLRSGGNEPNANSVVVRLDYGSFSMLLTGDAEAQTEDRMINGGANILAKILKVGHHGSRYATSEDFLRRGKFEAAIISDGQDNRYGHPSQEVLDRLRAANIKVYRTDLQGEITVTTRGQSYEIKPEREARGDLFAGRTPQKDDSARSGFVQYGDFGPPPRASRNRNNNTNAARGR
ncbi:MAG: MBL fold metallo-hydrolase [Pyrinomonadaceae bacterium]|nr:MBL fold metallo-hydrolase [Pyrinomonadaceae bacterium]